MDWIDYREKLGIGFNDDGKIKIFYTRISNVLNSLIQSGEVGITADEYFAFCDETGARLDSSLLADYRGGDRFRDCVHIIRDHESLFEDYLSYFVWFVNTVKNEAYRSWNKENYKNLLTKCLMDSHIQYELLEDEGKFFIFPKGAEEMDAGLVSQPLSWLAAYPNTHTAFVKALKEYSEATPDNASDIADKFRKTLETFLREFFGNSAPLEKNKVEYGRYLKSIGVPAEITGNMETLLQAYANFMNGYAKHQDATSMNVLEYLMYQTGNIIRLLITLRQPDIVHQRGENI